MNEFSILCRVLGSLFYRQPQDPLLVPLFTLISEGKLSANWPLEQDELLTRLQKSCDMPQLAADYNALFVGDECAVPPYRSAWVEGAKESDVRAFLLPAECRWQIRLQIILARCCWRLHGLKTSLRKMKVKHSKPCLWNTCCPGAARSLAKLKRMQTHSSGVPWHR